MGGPYPARYRVLILMPCLYTLMDNLRFWVIKSWGGERLQCMKTVANKFEEKWYLA